MSARDGQRGEVEEGARLTNPPTGTNLPAYSGITSFMRVPPTRDLTRADVAVVGIPFEGGATSYRGGARFGPRKIREASLLMWGYNSGLHVAPLHELRVVDYTDVAVVPGDVQATMAHIEAEVGTILNSGVQALAMGGDHSITLGLLRAHVARYGKLALIQLDAHCDLWPGAVDHGTVFRHAIEEGLVDPQAYVQVGMRGPVWKQSDLAMPQQFGIAALSCDACLERGTSWVVDNIRQVVGRRPVYVTLDMDVADPAYAPGVTTPEIGGLTSHDLQALVRGLQGLGIVGADVVEISPPYDYADITAILAANLAFELLSLFALNREPNRK